MSICAWSGSAVMTASPWAVTDGGLMPEYFLARGARSQQKETYYKY